MSWFTPILLTPNERSSGACAPRAADSYSAESIAASMTHASAGLGSARASVQWAWAVEPALMPPTTQAIPAAASAHTASAAQGTCLRAPVEVLREMSAAARGLGRSESEVWVEAAREWLRRREGEPGAPPAAAAPVVASSVAAPRRISRLWDDIDALLIELRAPAIAAAHECDGAPAA